MKKIFILSITLLPCFSFAQGGLLNKVKHKVADRIDQKVDEALDNAFNKEKEASEPVNTNTANTEAATIEASKKETMPIKSFSRYDFVPGDCIVYTEDFSQDVIGEFPLHWSTNNSGEVVTLDNVEGRWLKLSQSGHYLAPYLKNLSENFTVEFDLIFSFPKSGKVPPYLQVGLMKTPEDDPKGKSFFNNHYTPLAQAYVNLWPSYGENCSISLYSEKESVRYFYADYKFVKGWEAHFHKPIHIAISVQKQRFRLWLQGEKLYDMPDLIPAQVLFNRLFLQLTSSNYDASEFSCYISNWRVAQGLPDTRSKLITEGKFVTNGIHFAVNADVVKPESYGVIREIAVVLKENPKVKVKIVGHTDSDGEADKNVDLSRRRAAAVKKILIAEMGIEATRLETDGSGEAKPVADNATKEGKAQNRRVEFIRL